MVSRFVVSIIRRGRRGGSIINKSSESGVTGSPHHPAMAGIGAS